jgi:hypothetical protein
MTAAVRGALGGLVAAMVLAAGPALAQTTPPPPATQPNPGNPADFTRNPHPTMPWGGITSPGNNPGTVLRYIAVPPQPVTVQVPASVPDGFPRQMVTQTVEIPGYQIVETTTGFFYPERWTLDQLNVGVYQWRRLPAEFRRKP